MTCDSSVVFSGTPVSYDNKTDHHDLTEILLKVALSLKHVYYLNDLLIKDFDTSGY